jgi:aminomethyltransferase
MEQANSPLIQTALHAEHTAAGAKMVPYAGYAMPVSYTGLVDEHHAVRNRYGMFDVSHMGEFRVKGPQALELVQHISSNDASKLVPGKVQYSCMPNGKGGIVDDLLVYCVAADEFMLVVNASNRVKDWHWIQQNNSFDAVLTDESDTWSLIALQGPEAAVVLQPLCEDITVGEMGYYTFQFGTVCGRPCLVSATGYTGAGGFELYLKNADAAPVWQALAAAGVPLCGLGARDTLRLEAGFCLYGNDIDESTSPIAAGLGWITKFTKAFVDSERLQTEKENGSNEILRGLVITERGIPRQGYTIENESGEAIGRITSGTSSPTLGHSIAMGYIKTADAKLGNTVYVRIRKNAIPAEVVRPGFLPK